MLLQILLRKYLNTLIHCSIIFWNMNRAFWLFLLRSKYDTLNGPLRAKRVYMLLSWIRQSSGCHYPLVSVYSDFQIVQAPQAIANPAAIFANGAINKIIRPKAIHTAPSQVVLSLLLSLIHLIIVFSFQGVVSL